MVLPARSDARYLSLVVLVAGPGLFPGQSQSGPGRATSAGIWLLCPGGLLVFCVLFPVRVQIAGVSGAFGRPIVRAGWLVPGLGVVLPAEHGNTLPGSCPSNLAALGHPRRS